MKNDQNQNRVHVPVQVQVKLTMLVMNDLNILNYFTCQQADAIRWPLYRAQIQKLKKL